MGNIMEYSWDILGISGFPNQTSDFFLLLLSIVEIKFSNAEHATKTILEAEKKKAFEAEKGMMQKKHCHAWSYRQTSWL